MNLRPSNPSVGSRRTGGVALVATLIMLSLVTFMVVAFLGVARRERRTIEAQTGQSAARSANDAALARVQAEIIARMIATGDKGSFGMMVPTNYQNSAYPFVPFPVAGYNSPTNVHSAFVNSTYFGNPTPANLNNYFLPNLANLQYDPRLPVFAPYYANTTPYDPLHSETNEGRFMLDFNRNGLFDSTTNSLVGDPHWIGMLEFPDQPHGPDNRGIGRYTYLAVPVGQTLDLNMIHNAAKRRGSVALPAQMNAAYTTYEGYYRNLGLGPQEMNTAAMLAEANPYWRYSIYDIAAANQSGSAPAATDSFRDAFDLLMFRANTNYNNLSTLTAQFGAGPAANLVNAQFDVLGNGPLMNSSNLTVNVDAVGTQWPGGSNTAATAQRFFDFNELFLTTRGYSGNFTMNLQYLGTNNLTATPAGERDRRTAYGLLSTLGVDSFPVTNKLNLNWSNAPFPYLPGQTNITLDFPGGDYSGFTSWPADGFFYNTAELMLRASITPSVFINTNWVGFGGGSTNVLVTNYYFGTNFLGNNMALTLSVTNIPIHPASFYSPEVHRILQLTANLYDATTTNPAAPAYPTLFRPYFKFNTNGWPSNDLILITGYTTNLADTSLLGMPVYDLTDPNSRMAMYQDTNAVVNGAGVGTNALCVIAGTPVIVGVKRGYPNFNEFGVQTLFSDTRRLEFVKTNATNIGPLALVGGIPLVQTNQSQIIGLTNIYGFEAWNSYATSFPFPANPNRPLRLVFTNIAQIILTNEFGPLYTNYTTNGANILIAPNTWPGTASGLTSFKSFFFTNVPQLSTNLARGYAYATNYPPLTGFTNGGFIPASPTGPGSPSIFNRSNGFPDMRLGITITNSIIFALYEPNSNRVVDFVNLTNLVTGLDLATALRVTNSPVDLGVRYWFTNRAGASVFTQTLGISNQIAMCLDTNINAQATNLWRQYSLNTPIVREIDRFRRFMGTNGILPPNQRLPLGTTVQSPFNPTRLISFTASWEANDPLVHYTTRDMADPYRSTLSDQVTPIVPPIAIAPPPGTLYRVDFGLINGRPAFQTNGGYNRYFLPWSRALDPTGTRLANLTNFYVVAPPAYDMRLKDSGIFRSDEWDFPQRKFANLGWIGRVHRGTPWQTVYLKSDAPNPTNWFYWAHSVETNPTNDWRLVDVFTAAINSDATRGLLSVNQTNSVAWAGALGGTLVLSNNGALIVPMTISPTIPGAATQLTNIIGGLTNGLINTKQRIPMWNPVGNYSAGDMAGYLNGQYGFINYFVALNGTNQNQNPFTQVVSNNFSYWTNVYFWSAASNYAVGNIVAYYGVSYASLINGNVNYPPDQNPGQWAPYPSRSFPRVGSVLATPELTVRSPYLNVGQPWQLGIAYAAGVRVYWQGWYYQATRAVPVNQPPNPYLNYADPRTMAQTYWWPLESPAVARNGGTVDALNDVFIERIPQQTLGLLQVEESPRFLIYAYGQSLKPADRGVYVVSGPYQGMVTNYQITGEVASRALVRVEGLPVSGFLPRPLPAGAPLQVTPRVIVEGYKLLPSDY